MMVQNDKSAAKNKRRKLRRQTKRVSESEIKHRLGELVQANLAIEDAQAAIARIQEELRVLQWSNDGNEKALVSTRKALGEAKLRLGLSMMKKRKILEGLAPLRLREPKRKK